jgi:hypothetical protein
LIVNHKIPNDKLIGLIKVTVNESFEKFNAKYKGKYIDLFKAEDNFNVPILSSEQFQLKGYGYSKDELKTAIKNFIVIFNDEISKGSLLTIIKELKKHTEDGTETIKIVKYLKNELKNLFTKIIKQNLCLIRTQ